MANEDAQRAASELGAVPLFARLDPDGLAAVAEVAPPFEAGPGHVLVQPGMVGAGLFVITDGTVALTVHDSEVELGPGEFFGELSLLDDRAVRTTRVRARTPVHGYCIDRDHFEDLLEAQPKIAVAMLRVLARRLVDLIAEARH